MTTPANAFDINGLEIKDIPDLTAKGIGYQTQVKFNVGTHGPFYLFFPINTDGTTIKAAIDSKVQALRYIAGGM